MQGNSALFDILLLLARVNWLSAMNTQNNACSLD
uniref:Uncharacterized protein n=1 Tax=Anguilla anguilla TaxID=7936 RepID=A0A0E9XKY5_ANGAN